MKQKLGKNVRFLFSMLALVACSGSDQRAPGSKASVTIGKQQSSLTASTTLTQALANRVVPVPGVTSGGFIAASIKGDVDVEHDGSAVYKFPLWVPDGVRELKPDLGVEYDSHHGTGLLGPKWNISGLSVITRCSQTLAGDGLQRPTSMSGDTFCLGTSRLVRTSGSAGGLGEFRTEMNPFQKIEVTHVGTGGVLTFKVFQPDGRIFYYGRTASSRLDLKAPSGSAAYHAYYLDRIEDRYGNSILITYRSDHTWVVGSKQAQERVPELITWGGTGNNGGLRSVRFFYTPASSYDPLRFRRFVDGYTIVGGQRLARLEMWGPNGTGSTMLLKKYNFTYTTPTITSERLLNTISECNGNDVCKRPTSITWDTGSTAHAEKFVSSTVQFDRFTDLQMTMPDVTAPDGFRVSLINVYRRIIPVDMNVDGRDDIVYRAETSFNGNTCLAWAVRLNVSSGSDVKFSAPSILPGADQTDPACGGNRLRYPHSGDPLFTDFNRDDFPDFFFAAGNNGDSQFVHASRLPAPENIQHFGYFYHEAWCPFGLLSCHGFAGSQNFDDPTWVDISSPWISIGDISGWGVPQLIRRRRNSNGLFHTTRDRTWGVTEASNPFTGYHLVDLDGDATSEVVMDRNFFNGAHHSDVSSPTMSGSRTDIPPNNPGTPPQTVHWLLDLNGDGLMDIAEVNSTNPDAIVTRMNTARGTLPPVTTTLPSGWRIGQSWRDGFETGARVVDFDLDGRQDLMLVDHGPAPGVSSRRSNVRVIKSNGLGGFIAQSTTSIPIGAFADGAQAAKRITAPVTPNSHGYRTTVTLDVNGDGLTDVLQIEGQLKAYVRQGNKPDMVTRIGEGTGRQIDIAYGPASDPAVHTRDMAACHGSADPQRRLACLLKDRWLPKQITVSGWQAPGQSVSETTRYTYTGGLLDRLGRGFLGFMRRDIYASNSRHTTITYATNTILDFGIGNFTYTYPHALLPREITLDVDTPHGPNTHHRQVETLNYSADATGIGPTTIRNISRYMVLLQSSSKKNYDCVGNGAGGCSGPLRLLNFKEDTYTYDPVFRYNELGKPTNHTTIHRDANGVALRTDVEKTIFVGFDNANWLMPVSQIELTSTSSTVSPPETVTRTFRFSPDLVRNTITNLLTGDASSIELEPFANNPARRLLTLGRDARGRITTLDDKEVATGTTRRTTSLYEDADGVYTTTTTNALGHKSRIWRHPGFGFVVETDDPNNLASRSTYDTFGRLLDETSISGSFTSYTYADSANPVTAGGTDKTIFPEGESTRQIKVHTDSFGRETIRTTPVDAARSTKVQTKFDGFGRLVEKQIRAGQTGAEEEMNTYTYVYDDLDRLLSECHLTSVGLNACKTNTYDGPVVTQTDESNRSITNISDPLGRPSIQRAAGNADASFTYGAFGLLRMYSLADGSSRTDFAYDVHGHQTTITRTRVGTRRTKYNAFGEVAETWKQREEAAEAEKVTYTRDLLGRIRTITGSGMNRTFHWDAPASSPTTPAPNAKGKVVDMTDGNTRVHYDYGTQGMMTKKTWSASVWGGPTAEVGSAGFEYDVRGRLSRLTYPKLGSWSDPLVVVHAYDAYTGDVSSLSDAASPTTPLWKVTQRNSRGAIQVEVMRAAGAQEVLRISDYYSSTAQLLNTSLQTTNPSTQQFSFVSSMYEYDRAGLPSEFLMSGTGISVRSHKFGYDNLGRLTHWVPATLSGGVDVSVNYTYDSDGNLTGRSWGSPAGNGNVTYGVTPKANGYTRTVAVSGSGLPTQTDLYQVDPWGRIIAAPAAGLGYNALDEVISVVESNGRENAIYRDASGNRVATTYGTQASGNPIALYTLDDLAEIRSSASGNEERCRLRANGKLVGELVRTSNTPTRTATFYLTDNVGSVLGEATLPAGVTARALRDPFGNLINDATNPHLPRDPEAANQDGSGRLGYADHPRENNWGVVDMQARFYSPRLGRFTSGDAVIVNAVDRRAYNAFAYAWNNPVAMIDKHGHDAQGALRFLYSAGYSLTYDGADGRSGHNPVQPQHEPSTPSATNGQMSAGTPEAQMSGGGGMSGSDPGPRNGTMGNTGHEPNGPDDSITTEQVMAAMDLATYAISIAVPGGAVVGLAWGAMKTGYYLGQENYEKAAQSAIETAVSPAFEKSPGADLVFQSTNQIISSSTGDRSIDPGTYQCGADGQASGQAAADAARNAGPSGARGSSGSEPQGGHGGAPGGGPDPGSANPGSGGGRGSDGAEGRTGASGPDRSGIGAF